MPPHNQSLIVETGIETNEVHAKKIDAAKLEDEPAMLTSFDDALDMVGFGKVQIIVLLISGLIIMTVLTETMGMSFIMPAANCDLELTDNRKGLISSVSFIGILVAAQLWGYLADTQGRRKLIMLTMFISCSGTIVSSFVTNFWLFLVIRFLVGFFISSSSATIYAYLGEFSMLKHRAATISYACIFAGVAQFYVPVMASIVLPGTWSLAISENLVFRPWRALLIVYMLPGLVAAILLSRLPESGKFLIAQGKEEQSLHVLRWMYTMNKGSRATEMPVQRLRTEVNQELLNQTEGPKGIGWILKSFWAQTVPLFQRPLVLHFAMCSFLMFGVFFVSAGIGMWFAEIQNRISSNDATEAQTVCNVLELALTRTQQQLRENDTQMDVICDDTINTETFMSTTIMGGYYLLCYVIYAVAINFVSQGFLLRAYLFGSGAAGLALQWVNHPIAVVFLFSSHIILAGVCISMLTGVVVLLIPTQFRGMAVSIALMFGRLGSIVGSNIVGVILAVNCAATFYLYTIFILVCAVISLFLPV